MSAPKSILKKPTQPYVHSAPASAPPPTNSNGSKRAGGGSKLKHTIAVAQPSSQSSKSFKERQSKGNSQKAINASRANKKVRVDNGEDESDGEDEDMSGDDFADADEEGAETDTDDEIEKSKKGKAKQTPKRKRATTAQDFGSAMTSLLTEPSRPIKSKPSKANAKASTSTSTSDPSAVALHSDSKSPLPTATATPSAIQAGPSKQPKQQQQQQQQQQPILSLSRAKLPPSIAESKLERRAARQLKKEKEEKEDRARVRDVVEGWSHLGVDGQVLGGLEFEKGLRKTAQRGVIKLFNAILTAHKQSAENDITIRSASDNKRKNVPISGIKGQGKKDKDNILGRGSKEELTKEGFLELVKKGTA